MKRFFANWARLLEEKRAVDYHFKVKRSPRDINIEILDKESAQPVEGKPNQHGESTGIAHMRLQKRDDNAFWEVASVSSPKGSSGVGKELYLLALELASSSGLSPDSIDISPAALSMWNNYLKRHPQVSIAEKESEEDTSTDDPYKYIFYIEPSYESDLDVDYERVEKEEEPQEEETEALPFDPDVDLDDYLAGIDDYEYISEGCPPEDVDKVSKVVIYKKNGQILLLRRADGENNWDLPGGHLHKGENHEDGARRETKEETNLDISDMRHVNDRENTKFYKCAAPKGDIRLQPEEHMDFKWVNPSEIGAYPLRNSLKSAILAAIKVVKEDFQQNVKKNYSKLKFKMIGQGKNKYNIGGKMEKPSYKRSKSAPPGFGGSLE